jgi:hypothetical protein
MGIWPPFQPQVFQENEEIITRCDPDGTTVIVRKNSASLPHPVARPGKDRKSWEQLKT